MQQKKGLKLELKTITNRGVIETDAMISFLAVLFMIFLMLAALNQIITEKQEKELNYLKSKAIFFADSLIKNSNEKEPEKGIAFYNEEKKRVEENVIDLSLMEKIEEKNFPEKLKEIRIDFGEEIKFGEKKGNCFEVRRFVLIQQTGKKGIIYVTACD